MNQSELENSLRKYEKLLAVAERDSKKACEARGSIGTNSTRARMTTANARWMAAAEHRDRIARMVDELKENLGIK